MKLYGISHQDKNPVTYKWTVSLVSGIGSWHCFRLVAMGIFNTETGLVKPCEQAQPVTAICYAAMIRVPSLL